MKKQDFCIACGCKESEFVTNKIRNNEDGVIVDCAQCGLRRLAGAFYVEPEKFYEEDYSRKYYTGDKSDESKLFNTFFPLQKLRFEPIEKYFTKESSVLDIGCSVGYFLSYIKNEVKNIVGCELNKKHASYASSCLNSSVFDKPFTQCGFVEGSFDVITMFHVMEHMSDPISELNEICKLLKPGGTLIIEVPNLMNPLVSFYGIESFMNFWYQKPHLYYYNKKTISFMLDKTKFHVEDVFVRQETGFLNHMHWNMTGVPVANRSIAINDELMIESNDGVNLDKISELYQNFNNEYKDLLQKSGYGDALMAVCRKKI